MKNVIENQTFPKERDLYNLKDTIVKNCKIEGEEDGESALKECRNIQVIQTDLKLRYPLWHDTQFVIKDSHMYDTCRAALWYCNQGSITNSQLHGIKALRECSNVSINHCDIISDEFGWKCNDIVMANTTINSAYLFFDSSNITLRNVTFKGKYSFQYIRNLIIDDCVLDTKDAFWHSKNVVIKNSIVKGEYLGWYSEDLTLINCKITGLQPLCYCKHLTLINCTMEGCDLAFENCTNIAVEIIGSIKSIKNPLSGSIKVDEVEEIIFDNPVYEGKAEIIVASKN